MTRVPALRAAVVRLVAALVPASLPAGTGAMAATLQPAPPAPGEIVLPASTRAAEVRRVQANLTALGYDPGPIDGRFGPRTCRAIRAFMADQRMRGGCTITPGLTTRLASALGGGPEAARHQPPPAPAPTGNAVGEVTHSPLRFFGGRWSGKARKEHGIEAWKVLARIGLQDEPSTLLNARNALAFATAFAPHTRTRYFMPRHQGGWWKGENEFERGRARHAFQQEVAAPILAAAPELPVDLTVVHGLQLDDYDHAREGFPLLTGSGGFVERLPLGAAGWRQGQLVVPGSVPRFLPLPPGQAEVLLRILAEKRQVFLAADVTVTERRGALFGGRVEALTLYADEWLRRPIARLAPPAVPEPADDGPIPERVEPHGPVLYEPGAPSSADTAALLVLHHRPDLLAPEAWPRLAAERHLLEARLFESADDWYAHDPWGPFFSFVEARAHRHFEPDEERFRQWSEARAAGLPDQLTYRSGERARIRSGQRYGLSEVVREMNARAGHPMRLPLGGSASVPLTECQRVWLELPEDADAVQITLSRADLRSQAAWVDTALLLAPTGARTVDHPRGDGCDLVIASELLAVEIMPFVPAEETRPVTRVRADAEARAAFAERQAAEEAARAAREAGPPAQTYSLLDVTAGMRLEEVREALAPHFAPDETTFDEEDMILFAESGDCLYFDVVDGRIEEEVGSLCLAVTFERSGDGPGAARQIYLRQVLPGEAADEVRAAFVGRFGEPEDADGRARGSVRHLVMAWGDRIELSRERTGRTSFPRFANRVLEASLRESRGVTLSTLRLDDGIWLERRAAGEGAAAAGPSAAGKADEKRPQVTIRF